MEQGELDRLELGDRVARSLHYQARRGEVRPPAQAHPDRHRDRPSSSI